MVDYKLYLGDCLEVISGLDDGSVAAVITDPPYSSGANETSKKKKSPSLTHNSVNPRPVIEGDSMGALGFDWFYRRLFVMLRQKTIRGGHLVCFTDWRMMPQFAAVIEAAGWRWNDVIVWNKKYIGLGSGFRGQHEMAVVASKGIPKWHTKNVGNVLDALRMTKTEHPHQKPVELLDPIVRTCTPEGATVLDPFMGSGSTGVACMQTVRRFVGVELDPNYYDIAQRRIAEAHGQVA